jgi:hypothetical protein
MPPAYRVVRVEKASGFGARLAALDLFFVFVRVLFGVEAILGQTVVVFLINENLLLPLFELQKR